MHSSKIRQEFLKFFESERHTVLPSASLLPQNDKSLLFVNAGMAPFKDYFLNPTSAPYKRVVTSQGCLRAGGKHNDLENVGFTTRHHTFFEMLGNFSFGDYFKQEAITYAWQFLTHTLNIPAAELWVTVHKDDAATANIWLDQIKIDPQRLSYLGDADNFWSMGDTGPCGPCSEVFYDYGDRVAGDPPGGKEEGERYVEIWNLVFTQYNKTASGKLDKLPHPCVDTGMGLERISAVMQGVRDNYATDLFVELKKSIGARTPVGMRKGDEGESPAERKIRDNEAIQKQLSLNNPEINLPEYTRSIEELTNPSLKVISDHIRTSCILISEGITPSNAGRGYVLRRIIRRAVRHAQKIYIDLEHSHFIQTLVAKVAQQFTTVYPQIKKQQQHIQQVLDTEKDNFLRTLYSGLTMLGGAISHSKSKIIPGKLAFTLHDTYGFPLDLTQDIARERGLSVDISQFEYEMAQQQQRSRSKQQFAVKEAALNLTHPPTKFIGYTSTSTTTTILAIIIKDPLVDNLVLGNITPFNEATLVLDTTVCYAQGGGQIGDSALITSADNDKKTNDKKTNDKQASDNYTKNASFAVSTTINQQGHYLHQGKMQQGQFKVGDRVTVSILPNLRQQIAANHSATHLLHAALRQIIGAEVQQKGSLVDAQHLRFDFSAPQLTKLQLEQITSLVNQQILSNLVVQVEHMSIENAQQKGALALFNEKYLNEVRVITMGDNSTAFSMELCGGTHVTRTGEIGAFYITSEISVAAGIRRIEAITGQAVIKRLGYIEEQNAAIARAIHAKSGDDLNSKINLMLNKQAQSAKQLAATKQKLYAIQDKALLNQSIKHSNIDIIAAKVECDSPALLRTRADNIKKSCTQAVIILGAIQNGKVFMVVSMTKNIISKVAANDLAQHLAPLIGGNGGGRADMAQIGGSLVNELDKTILAAVNWIEQKA